MRDSESVLGCFATPFYGLETVDVSLAKADAGGKQNSVTKSGAGTLVLTNTANSSLTKTLTINAGTVRGTPLSSLPAGKIELRGGVPQAGRFPQPFPGGMVVLRHALATRCH